MSDTSLLLPRLEPYSENDLADLLTRAALFSSGDTAFRKTGELARAIISLGGHYSDKTPNVVNTLLTQVFKNERSCPVELADGIIAALREKLPDTLPHHQDLWIKRVELALQDQGYKVRGRENPFPSHYKPELLLAKMYAMAETEPSIIIVQPDVYWRGGMPSAFNSITKELETLIIKRLTGDGEPLRSCKFVIHEASNVDDVDELLFGRKASSFFDLPALDPDVVDYVIRDGQHVGIGPGLVQTWGGTPVSASLPLLVFDRWEESVGYSYSANDNTHYTITEWPSHVVRSWLHSFDYVPFKKDEYEKMVSRLVAARLLGSRKRSKSE